MNRTPKPKKCKVCREEFQPIRPLQTVCGRICAQKFGRDMTEKNRKVLEKAERMADRAKREAMKTRPEWIKEAQKAFNAYIRARDRAAGHPCISSGRPLDWSGNAVDAGHYRSVGAAPHLRYDPRNCHAQSKHDNQFKAGNVVQYRINLIQRIGLEAVEALEADNTPRHYTIEDLKAIRDKYRRMAKELESQRETESA